MIFAPPPKPKKFFLEAASTFCFVCTQVLPPFEAFDVSHDLASIREINFPNERSVAKDPNHDHCKGSTRDDISLMRHAGGGRLVKYFTKSLYKRKILSRSPEVLFLICVIGSRVHLWPSRAVVPLANFSIE